MLAVCLGVVERGDGGGAAEELFAGETVGTRSFVDRLGRLKSVHLVDVRSIRRALAAAGDLDASEDTVEWLDDRYTGWPTVDVLLVEGSMVNGPHTVPVHCFRHLRAGAWPPRGVMGAYLSWRLVKPALDSFERVDMEAVRALNAERVRQASASVDDRA